MSFKACKLSLKLVVLLCLSGVFTRERFPKVSSRLRNEIEDEERNAICCARKMKCCRSTEDEPNIEIRAVMVRCPSNNKEEGKPRNIKTLVNSNREENIKKYPGFDDDEPLTEMRVRNCNRKLIISMRIDNKGHISKKSQFVIIDHVFDPLTDKSQRLLNPYVIKLRQEHVTQMYGMKFLNYVNSEAKEVIYNKHMSNYTGCNTSRNNPTCGIVTYNDKVIPYSEGFCCSCDSLINIKRQPKSTVQTKEVIVSYTDPSLLMDGVGCPMGAKPSEHEELNEEPPSTEATNEKALKRAKLTNKQSGYQSIAEQNLLNNKKISTDIKSQNKNSKMVHQSAQASRKSNQNKVQKKKPFNLAEKNEEVKIIENQEAVQNVVNLDNKLKLKFNDLKEEETGLDLSSSSTESPTTKKIQQAHQKDKLAGFKLRSIDAGEKYKFNSPVAEKFSRVDENDETLLDTSKKNVAKTNNNSGTRSTKNQINNNYNDNMDVSDGEQYMTNEKMGNDDLTNFNSNDKITSDEEKVSNGMDNSVAEEQNGDMLDGYRTNRKISMQDKLHWNFQKQELTHDDTYEDVDKENNKRIKRSTLLRNMDISNTDLANDNDNVNVNENQYENIDKRQISSGGSQVRGAQSCANRYTPPGLNPDTYHESTHCLRFSEVWYAVYELQEPIVEHSMRIQIFEKHEDAHGATIWRDITKGHVTHLGSLTPNFDDDCSTVSVTYNSKYMKPDQSMYALNFKEARLLVPEGIDKAHMQKYPEVRGGPKEYLIVHPDLIAVDGDRCNVAGVGFEAFYKQPNRCGVSKGTCLANQPRSLWRHDHKAEKLHKKGCFFLRHYGILPENPIRKNGTNQLYLSLEYSGTYSSMLDMEITADSNAALRPSSTAIITEVYVDSTSLIKTILTVKVTNGGLISANFYTRLSDCPLDLPASFNNIESKTVLIAPQHQHVFTLELRGRLTSDIFHCSVEIMNGNSELVALRRIKIQKSDRCICTWHCLCACIGSSDGLKCKLMSIEQYHAAGFQGSLPIATSVVANIVVSDVLEMLTFILIFMLLTLLFLGVTKALIGICCCPPMGMWGLCILLDLPKRMNGYYEAEIQDCEVQYDVDNWPIHPVNKKRVRNISRSLEFCTNVFFFFTYPVVVLLILCKRLCCPYYTFEHDSSKQSEKSPTERSYKSSSKPQDTENENDDQSSGMKVSKSGATSNAPSKRRSRIKPSVRSSQSNKSVSNKTRSMRSRSSKKTSPSLESKRTKGTNDESEGV